MRIIFACAAAFVLFPTTSVGFSVFQPATSSCRSTALLLAAESWTGDVVANSAEGKISGCTLQASENSPTEWIITIDGVEADLGRFSDAIFRKITRDAKQERFQGFRPGTIPPHLLPTYVVFAMDECARETVLEAMQQNNVRPFETARTDMTFEKFSIPPPAKKKKKSKKRKKTPVVGEDSSPETPQWLVFDTMKECIDAGWKPGQSFSFVATNVKGQKVKGDEDTKGASPLGLNY